VNSPESDRTVRTMTLEAFADTIIPGEKRSPADRAVAGIAPGGGAVAAGAIAVLETPEGGMEPALDDLAAALNGHAARYCGQHGLDADPTAAFVGLSADHRIALVRHLVAAGHPERAMWVGLAMFSYMAFDTGAHLNTAQALAQGHPGLLTLGFSPPDPDGLWRFPNASYGRALARIHPDTTATGSPG
jgi:enediyne biosynthesis protein E8